MLVVFAVAFLSIRGGQRKPTSTQLSGGCTSAVNCKSHQYASELRCKRDGSESACICSTCTAKRRISKHWRCALAFDLALLVLHHSAYVISFNYFNQICLARMSAELAALLFANANISRRAVATSSWAQASSPLLFHLFSLPAPTDQ